MSANKKKLIVLGYGALLSIVVSLITWAVFYANGTSGLDSLKVAGAVLASGLGITLGVIASFTFKDDIAMTPPTQSRSEAPSPDDRVGQVPDARSSSVPPSADVRS
jgi:protein-S-isoprenylcysteine O-methyltransferase Ste14